jgi:hypothetical protein
VEEDFRGSHWLAHSSMVEIHACGTSWGEKDMDAVDHSTPTLLTSGMGNVMSSSTDTFSRLTLACTF